MVQGDNDEPNRLAGLIRRRREERGWLQRDLADAAGVAPSIITRIEAGITTNPRRDTLASISRALGLRQDDVLSDEPSGTGRLPAFQPYLRARYADLPPEAQERMTRYFARVRAEYGASGDGPSDGEDE